MINLESSEERCAFVQERLDFLSHVVSSLENVYVGLEQETKLFASQKAKIGNCSFLNKYEQKEKRIENRLKNRFGEKDIRERLKGKYLSAWSLAMAANVKFLL